jgi:5-methylcytosine-specific restriction protein A
VPAKPLRPCAKVGCSSLTSKKFCALHTGEPKRLAQLYDASRADDAVRHLYGTRRWRRVSLEVISLEPICRECRREPSSLADHVIPSQQYVAQHDGDTEYFFDYDNLQGLGKQCHAKKTARDSRGYGGQAPGALRPATGVQHSTRVSRSQNLSDFSHAAT